MKELKTKPVFWHVSRSDTFCFFFSLCTKSARTLADNLSEMKDFIEHLNCEEYSENLYRILNENKYVVMGMIIKR